MVVNYYVKVYQHIDILLYSITPSSNGRTTVSEAVYRGSTPRGVASLLTSRLMVGRWILVPSIVVRPHRGHREIRIVIIPQPSKLMRRV